MKTITILLLLITFRLESKTTDSVQHFFKESQFQNIKISPDGKRLAFTYNKEKTSVIGIIDRKTNAIKSFKYKEQDKILDFHWVTNERLILEVAKIVGNLDTKGGPKMLYGINYNGTKRKLLYAQQFSGFKISSLLENDKKHILLETYHFTDKGKSKLQKINIFNGELNYQGGLPSTGFDGVLVNENGVPKIGIEYVENEKEEFGKGIYKLFFKKPGEKEWKQKTIDNLDSGEVYNPVALSHDEKYVYVISDLNTKTLALYKYDLNDGTNQLLFHNALVDINSLERGHDNEIIAAYYTPNYSQVKFINNEHEDTKLLKSLYLTFPDSTVSIVNYTKNNDLAVIKVSSDKNPGEFFLYNKINAKLTYIASNRSWIDPKEMSERKPIKYKTRDGLEIHGYLTLPINKSSNLPTIVLPHGGPHGIRDYWGFDPEAQFLAHNGYAVLQVNFRGSGGYGNEFQELGYRQWGREMQNDITDGTKWLINSGIADKNRICIYGGSYGGYAALSGVVNEPNLYKCGLGYVGVYDLPTLKKRGDTVKRKSGVKYLDRVIGTNEKELLENSPARHVEKIKANLFIAHGLDDVRVPMAQYKILKKNLDKIGKPFKSMLRDEGHGYQLDKNKFDFYKEMLSFFNDNIGDI